MTEPVPARLLVVDDEPDVLHSFRRMLRDAPYRVETCLSGEEALARLAREEYDLVVMDIRMGGKSGLETLRDVSQRPERPFIILMTAFATTETTIEAIKLGAFDYILKPFEVPEMRALIERALSTRRSWHEGREVGRSDEVGDEIVGRSGAMQEVYKLIGRVAAEEVPVLITGESGTGKELVARALHRHSARADKIFLPVNCAAIPEALLESEFFGHERGSFTGAVGRRVGKFEQCDGGTIFLDEVGELAPAVQGKLLRLLEEGTFQRVGGSEMIRCDVRIVAATNRELAADVERGHYRADLFYRLNVVHVLLPPLRDRREDIPLLLDHFLSRMARGRGEGQVKVQPEVLEILRRHPWPGNVRQMENALRKAAATCRGGVVVPEDLPDDVRRPPAAGLPAAGTYAETLEAATERLADAAAGEAAHDPTVGLLPELQRRLIPAVLARVGGNQVKASQILGISRNTLRSHVKAHGKES